MFLRLPGNVKVTHTQYDHDMVFFGFFSRQQQVEEKIIPTLVLVLCCPDRFPSSVWNRGLRLRSVILVRVFVSCISIFSPRLLSTPFLFFIFWYPEMSDSVPNLPAALNAIGADKGIYLYAPVSKSGSSARDLVDLLAQRGFGLPGSSLSFRPSHHALCIRGPIEALRSFQTEIPLLRVNDTTSVRFSWSRPTPPDAPLVTKASTFRLRIDGIEDTVSKAFWESASSQSLMVSPTPQPSSGARLIVTQTFPCTWLTGRRSNPSLKTTLPLC